MCQKFRIDDFTGFSIKYFDETSADNFALLFRIANADKTLQKHL